MPLTASLILLSWQKYAQTTGPCLDTLLQSDWPAGAELLVVDNGSTDGTADQLRARWAGSDRPAASQLHTLESNLGFGGGMNYGATHAAGAWIVLVNSDTLWPRGALHRLIEVLDEQAPQVGMIGPVTNAAGNGQALHRPGLSHEMALRLGDRLMQRRLHACTPTYRTDFFCVAIRRDVWRSLQGLDPVFGLGYFEDFDFSMRLAAAGHEQRIAEDVFIVHAGSASFSAMRASQRALMKRNLAIFKQRHPGAKLLHQRVGNAQALDALCTLAQDEGWSEASRERAAWRMAMLIDEQPRSPLKRWWWKRSQRPLLRRLAQAGIEPRYPALD